MIVDVPPGLANGTYSVLWRTLSSDDGHTAQGYIAFTVGTQSDVRPVVPPATTVSSGPPLWLKSLARWTAYLGLAATLAIWPIWVLVLRPAISPAWQAGPALTRRVRRLAVIAFGMAMIGNLFALLVQTAGIDGGSFYDDLMTTLNDTRYGRLWLLRFGLLCLYGGALLAAAWWWPLKRPWRTAAALICAALLPLPFSEISHASAQTTGRTAAIAIDMLHLLAASLWVGGLFVLVGALVPTLRDLTSAGRRVVLGRAIPRFSAVALASWAVLGSTGLYSAWLQVGNLHGLFDTAYGHSLVAKLLMIVPLLALGAFNLLVVSRRVRRTTGDGKSAIAWSRHFALAVGAEVVLAVLVFLVVGRLTSQAPAREVLDQQAGQVTLDLAAEGRRATLSIAPGSTGPNHYRLDVGGDLLPADATALLRVELPSANTGQKEIQLIRAAGNGFEAHGSELSIAGDWSLEVILRQPNTNDWVTTATLAVGVTPPSSNVPGTPWHFSGAALLGLLLLVIGVAGVVLAWAVGRSPLRKESAGLGLAALAVGIVLLIQSRVEPATATREVTSANPIPADAASIARGQDVFTANCAQCHGPGGKGDGPAGAGLATPPADLTSSHARAHLDQDFFYWIVNGIRGSAMPAFGGQLTDNQIWDVINYLRTLQPPPQPTAASGASPPTTGPGTPVPADGLQVTLVPSDIQIGNVPLTAEVRDETGAPVTDAVVTFSVQSLDMNMGVTEAPATSIGNGRYEAEDVLFAMGGRWEVVVRVARPAQGAVSTSFLVEVG
jgi:copper transport protein